MDEDTVKQLIDLRGVDFILQEHDITMPQVFILLDELGYINLDRYEGEDE